jgi:serine/threonine protein phosphatase PrpC
MNMFTERLASWLARPSSRRGTNQPEGLSAILSSDIGLVRNENQDLIAAIRVNTPSNIGKPFFAMALLDGMGGMQDGKKCATIALSTFFYSLIKFRGEELEPV